MVLADAQYVEHPEAMTSLNLGNMTSSGFSTLNSRVQSRESPEHKDGSANFPLGRIRVSKELSSAASKQRYQWLKGMKQRRLTRDNCFSKDQIRVGSNDYTIENSRDSYDPDRIDTRSSKPRIQKRTSEQYDDEEVYVNVSKEVEQPLKDFANRWEAFPEVDDGPYDRVVEIAQKAHIIKHVEEVQKFYRTDHGYHQDEKILIEQNHNYINVWSQNDEEEPKDASR